MKFIDGGLEKVPGYRFSAVKCGIRYENRLDYCLIAADSPCNASAVFTKNKIIAAPVKITREKIKNPITAILVNATNANACTGTEGYDNAKILTEDIASRLGTAPDSVLMASTGVIGRQLPVKKMLDSHSELISGLSRDGGILIPQAIMTTDTVPKKACVSFNTGMGEFLIAGTAKGAGMIAPDMATLLAFIITSAPVKKNDLDLIFKRIIQKTLNAITIDGDMSTNDTAVILSPISKKPLSDKNDLHSFEEALHKVLLSLSEMLVADAEGATKLVKIHVQNASTDDDAFKIAKAVSESLLVKTAFFGNDPNWGRIAAAAGYSGAAISEEKLSIYYGEVPLLVKGKPSDVSMELIMSELGKRELSVVIDAGMGKSNAMMMTSDISVEYVKINSAYST